ncbi:PH domain-containing protein [Actinomadura verrucosospora]|uniref:PH domain-containing protein n=1 Tax=Actinomadura verrucosospora TaxID=46165 RepID=A0A7D4AK77_ACTVE|nr:PH domain-containing protein [Actinomadura verrucosospora]QKG20508.1 hypothetical protein ACTIVE_2146 [Actinomadura verrucosospora]
MTGGQKLRKSYRWALVAFWGAGAVLVAGMVAVAGIASSTADLVFLVLALPFAVNAWRFHRESVERSDDGVILRRLGARRIAWSQVTELRTGRGVAGRHVVLMLDGGGSVALPVPYDLGPVKERAFDEKAAVLRSWRSEFRAGI